MQLLLTNDLAEASPFSLACCVCAAACRAAHTHCRAPPRFQIGDGTNLVVVLAGELLKHAAELIEMGIFTLDIIRGYEAAAAKTHELLDELVVRKLETKDVRNKAAITEVLRPVIASKQYGYEDFLAPLIAEAALTVMPENTYNFMVDNIRVCKLLGGSLQQSEVVRGMVFAQDVEGSVSRVDKANVAVYTCSLELATTETKGNVLLSNAQELMNYSQSEENAIHELIKSIHLSGVNVIVTGSTVSEMARHFCNKYGILVVKITSQFELRRLCRTTNARAQVKLQPLHPSEQGYCARVYTRELGTTKVTVFEQDAKDESGVATIILRASTFNILNDIERAIDDAVNTVRSVGRDGRFVAGAGACEIELARRLHAFASKKANIDQYAINAFADALEIVPRILAENSGQDPIDIVSQLYAAHEKGEERSGVDIENNGVADLTKKGVVDHLATKANAMRLATDAVLTVLRVDQIIQSKPAGGPKAPQNQGHWDDKED
jgi:T-complex protein 1 subunit theta